MVFLNQLNVDASLNFSSIESQEENPNALN
jgi:hypothetical protein